MTHKKPVVHLRDEEFNILCSNELKKNVTLNTAFVTCKDCLTLISTGEHLG